MSTALVEADYNLKYFLQLMQSVLNSSAVPEPDEPLNWGMVYDIAVNHSLGGMLYYAIQKLPESRRPKGTMMAYLKQMHQEQIVSDLNLSFETERMLGILSSNGIKCMPFKGIVTKADYPVPYLRTMCDVDILCEPSNRTAVEKIFLENGYVKESVGEKDTSYRKDDILHFEMHSYLLTEESPAYSYFSDIWQRAQLDENSNIARMSLEDVYIYMLEHLANHVKFGGAGIRMYMDVYVFLKKHAEALDREYTSKILKEILLSDFEKKTLDLCQNWFSGNEEININTKSAWFILNSCTYGRVSVTFLSDSISNFKDNSSGAKNGVTRIINKLFPTLKWMQLRFKAVDKLPVLYPFFIPVHWIDRLIIRRNVTTKNIGKYFACADSQEAKELIDMFTTLGLKKRI